VGKKGLHKDLVLLIENTKKAIECNTKKSVLKKERAKGQKYHRLPI
jgi:hypothetical protein